LEFKEMLVSQVTYLLAAAMTLAGGIVYIGLTPAWAVGEYSAASVVTRPSGETMSAAQGTREFEYLEANHKAMAKMMRDMNIRPSGDVNRDFVAQMIPHHQGAIDMARALLKTGGNETLKRLAQEIIVTQKDEIAAMRLAIGESPSALER
jgi:hypothetical protein